MAATAARPSCLDASTSGTGSIDMSASLIVSLDTSGTPSSRARTGARVDFPLAGGPDTTTNRGWATGACCRREPDDRHPGLGDGVKESVARSHLVPTRA